MPRLLVVHHSPTPRVRELTDAVLAGAGDDAIEGVEVVARPALEATADDVLAADGYVLLTPANFGYLSGALKHFFDTTYDAVREPTAGRPFGYAIHGSTDTSGAERAMVAITTGLGWTIVAEPLTMLGELDDQHRERAYALGGTVAALVAG